MTSMLKTLAAKHHSTVSKTAAKYKAKIETRDGLRTCFEARKHREGKKDLVARFGGIILRQDRRAVIRDPAPAPAAYPRKELIKRLRKRECELCETGTTVAVHQVTGLKELGKPGPDQPACRPCSQDVLSGCAWDTKPALPHQEDVPASTAYRRTGASSALSYYYILRQCQTECDVLRH